MIANFLSDFERQKIKQIDLPNPPSYFDPSLLISKFICLLACVFLFRDEEYLATGFLFVILIFINLFLVARMAFTLKVRNYYKDLKSIRNTVDTPVWVHVQDYHLFTFIMPSEKIFKNIENMNKFINNLKKD